jgi:hypothetical protein
MKMSNANVVSAANEDTPQLYVACGRGPRSSLRVLRHGLEVTEMAVSELPGNPNAVWTVKIRSDGNEIISTRQQGCQIFLGSGCQNGKKLPNEHKIFQMIIHINIFQSKALKNVRKSGFLV